MNYPSLATDILSLFAEAQHLGRVRRGTIGRIIGRGHWKRELVKFWHSQHKTRMREWKRGWELANKETRLEQMRVNCRAYRARLKAKRGRAAA